MNNNLQTNLASEMSYQNTIAFCFSMITFDFKYWWNAIELLLNLVNQPYKSNLVFFIVGNLMRIKYFVDLEQIYLSSQVQKQNKIFWRENL